MTATILFLFLQALLRIGSPGGWERPASPNGDHPAAYCGSWTGMYQDDDIRYQWLTHRYPDGRMHVRFKKLNPDQTVSFQEEYASWWVDENKRYIVVTEWIVNEDGRSPCHFVDIYRTRNISETAHCYVDVEKDKEFCATRVDEDFEL